MAFLSAAMASTIFFIQDEMQLVAVFDDAGAIAASPRAR